MVEELLAQTVEELSILTAKKFAREKPRKIDRPRWLQAAQSGSGAPPAAETPHSRAIDRMFAFLPSRRGAA